MIDSVNKNDLGFLKKGFAYLLCYHIFLKTKMSKRKIKLMSEIYANMIFI